MTMSEPKAKKTRKTAAPAEAGPPVSPAPPGRPTLRTDEVLDEICDRLSQGEPLRQICRDERMPSWQTFYRWKAEDESLSRRIAHAREAGFDAIAEECLDIADETAFDTVSTEHGDRANTEWISRSKLRVDTRLKLLAKWDPKRYGDKMDLNHGGQDGNPVNMNWQINFVKPGDER
jgi:transposase